MTFAEKLKSIRKKAGMSQEKLAEKKYVSALLQTRWQHYRVISRSKLTTAKITLTLTSAAKTV